MKFDLVMPYDFKMLECQCCCLAAATGLAIGPGLHYPVATCDACYTALVEYHSDQDTVISFPDEGE